MRCFVSFIVALLLISASVRADDAVPPQLQGVGVDEKLGAQVPLDLKFTDEFGKAVSLKSLIPPNKPVVLQLSYFGCPMLCDTISHGLLNSMQNLDLNIGSDFSVINVSFNPRETSADGSKKKAGYVQQYSRTGAGDGWHFLVGDPYTIDELCKSVGFKYKWIEESQQFSHPAVLMILSPTGKVTRYLYGVEFPQQTLRLSLVEASEGKIGNTIDKVMMLCFRYSPSEGRYTLFAMGLMRLAGAITVVVLGGVLLRQYLKERRHRRLVA